MSLGTFSLSNFRNGWQILIIFSALIDFDLFLITRSLHYYSYLYLIGCLLVHPGKYMGMRYEQFSILPTKTVNI